MNQETCKLCSKKFPVHLLNELTVVGKGKTLTGGLICPICALNVRNKLHGLPPDAPFEGPKARALHAEAVKWLKSSGQQGGDS